MQPWPHATARMRPQYIAETGLNVEQHQVDMKAKQHKSAQYLAEVRQGLGQRWQRGGGWLPARASSHDSTVRAGHGA